jgi:hypothetical protein
MPEATDRQRLWNALWWLALVVAFSALFITHHHLNN